LRAAASGATDDGLQLPSGHRRRVVYVAKIVCKHWAEGSVTDTRTENKLKRKIFVDEW
jgi:hypothetical protein